jgi:6-phosphofructokinase 1
VLADAANGTFDDLEFDQEKYSWRVGGPNDIPCVHLRDVYRGEKPLEPRPSPFCTKSSCPVTIGDRTPLSLNRTFVSEDDRVLLKSMAFGCVESIEKRRGKRQATTKHRDRRSRTRLPFSPHHTKKVLRRRSFRTLSLRISPRAPKRRERDADGTSFASSSRTKKKKKPISSPDSLGASCGFDCDASGEFKGVSAGSTEDGTCNVCEFVPEFAKRAGPRALIYHDPATTHAAIVNCGGLCPGINDVIRSVVTTLETGYGVTEISGIRFGFGGFWKEGVSNLKLTRSNTSGVQRAGGSVIGTGRGGGDVPKIVDSIERQGINMVFVIGGNGSHAGADAISDECARRGLAVSVVGIPKTIDNDILHIDKTFGFDTAVEEAQKAIRAAAIEAKSALNGVGVVKLMGRQSGFIAMNASLASGEVDVCMIPEVDFAMEGAGGVVQHIKSLLKKQGHAVVVVAEGAGQEYVRGAGGTDKGGNPILGDIGPWFVKRLRAEMSCDVKYIDPTYMVRGIPANAHDSIYCTILGQNAVHGAFAGYTGISIGMVNTHAVFLPIPRLIERERLVDPDGRMWHRLLTSTGQPDFQSS